MKYTGSIYWDGEKPLIKQREKLIEWLSQFPKDEWFNFEVTLLGKSDNSAQQKLYFKWCDIIATEFGWDSGQHVHKYLKDTYNSGKTTKDFEVKDWSEYMIKVQAFANENNITLPLGNE